MRNDTLAFFVFMFIGLAGGYIISYPLAYTMYYINSLIGEEYKIIPRLGTLGDKNVR